jgi:site-specific DNA-methyltransferase (adenine-specific)
MEQETADTLEEHNYIINDDVMNVPLLDDERAQIIIADPPYNIGKNFGNDSDKQKIDDYLNWCDKWISQCLRLLKPNGKCLFTDLVKC